VPTAVICPCALYVTYGTANVDPEVALEVPTVPAVILLLCPRVFTAVPVPNDKPAPAVIGA